MSQQNPFRLDSLHPWLASPIQRALGLNTLADGYDQRPIGASPEDFLDYSLNKLGTSVTLSGEALEAVIPETGPVIIFANHPFGGLEGMAMTRALLSVRPDTKVLTNQMLSRIPELAPIFFGVDVLTEKAAHRNTASVRAAAEHLDNDGLLLIFPAGQVSAMQWGDFSVKDRHWNPMVGRLAQRYQATCVPIYVHGHNPLYFQLGGLIHKRVRTALLPRQLSNKMGKPIEMTVGSAITPKEYKGLDSAAATTDMFRMATYLLASKPDTERHAQLEPIQSTGSQLDITAIEQELNTLKDCKLLSKNQFDVYCAPFDRLNHVFEAIATARESTFRAVGEGTGQEKDSDQFDPDYYHLFIWDRDGKAIVGGYRLGETDKIVERKGVSALYSRSLYRFDENYINSLGPALEVGRSFVTQAYQRLPSSLDLLWRGIGQFLVRNPQYRVLFGCVSISSDHSKTARAFISDAMMESFRAEQKFLENVKPMVPLKVKGKVWSSKMLRSIQDISVFNKLVGQCDPGKTIPVLLRHYLALNGRFVGFTVNKGFNDSLDGLILVDLHGVPERYLTRYLGKDGLVTYRQYWEAHESTV